MSAREGDLIRGVEVLAGEDALGEVMAAIVGDGRVWMLTEGG